MPASETLQPPGCATAGRRPTRPKFVIKELTILHHTTNGDAKRIQLRHRFNVASRQRGRDNGFAMGSGGKRWLQNRGVFVLKPQVYELFRGFEIAYRFAWCRLSEIGAYGLYETGERTLPWWTSSHFVLMLVVEALDRQDPLARLLTASKH